MRWYEPLFGKEEKTLINRVLESGYVSEGEMCKNFCDGIKKKLGVDYAILTTSATAGLYLALKSIGVGKNDEVIIPSLTFVATKNAVELCGASPIYVDVEPKRFTMSAEETLKKVTRNTKAIMPVNYLGRKFDSSLLELAVQERIPIVEDSAGALGSCNLSGELAVYSLQANKIISSGQGGIIVTNNKDLADKVNKLKDFGREDKLENRTSGFNFKFNDILGAVALGQLGKLEERKELLKNQRDIYVYHLKDLEEIKWPELKKDEVLIWIDAICERRDELFDYLNKKDIFCRKPWDVLSNTKNSIFAVDNSIWLPNGPKISLDDIKLVSEEIKTFYKRK